MSAVLAETELSESERMRLYGWRDIHRTASDGTTVVERVALTLEDLLHPEFGDVAMISNRHDDERFYLAHTFRTRLAGVPGSLVLADQKIDWTGDTEGFGHHSPDVAVIHNVKDDRPVWTEFVVAKHGVRPSLIIEIVSPSYRVNDVVTKVDHYQRCRVPCYVIVDRRRNEDPPTLIGRVLREGAWQPLIPNDNGWLWLDAARVYLGVEGTRVRCYDPATSAPLPDVFESEADNKAKAAQIIVERQLRERAEAEAEQADDLRRRESNRRAAAEAAREQEARARAMADEAREQEAKARAAAEEAREQEARARAMAEEAHEQEAKARAAAEDAREQEARARAAAEARIAELEARLGRESGAQSETK